MAAPTVDAANSQNFCFQLRAFSPARENLAPRHGRKPLRRQWLHQKKQGTAESFHFKSHTTPRVLHKIVPPNIGITQYSYCTISVPPNNGIAHYRHRAKSVSHNISIAHHRHRTISVTHNIGITHHRHRTISVPHKISAAQNRDRAHAYPRCPR